MTVLVAYATKYGGTRAIAEHIAETLQGCGIDAFAQSVASAADLSKYEGLIVGSPLYMGSWMKEAVAFAQKNREVLASGPVWLFSSGPLGTATTDAEGHDVRESAGPKQFPDLLEKLHPRDHHVFFWHLGPRALRFARQAHLRHARGQKVVDRWRLPRLV